VVTGKTRVPEVKWGLQDRGTEGVENGWSTSLPSWLGGLGMSWVSPIEVRGICAYVEGQRTPLVLRKITLNEKKIKCYNVLQWVTLTEKRKVQLLTMTMAWWYPNLTVS